MHRASLRALAPTKQKGSPSSAAAPVGVAREVLLMAAAHGHIESIVLACHGEEAGENRRAPATPSGSARSLPTNSPKPSFGGESDVCRISTSYPHNYFGAQMEPASRQLLGCLPAMEASVALPVNVSSDLASPLRETLAPYKCFVVVETKVLEDGTRRGLLAAHRSASRTSSSLGWASISSKDGKPLIHHFARPLYEVVNALQVREGADTRSRPVCGLAPGELLHVLGARKLTSGINRVRVRLVCDDAPLGWLTVRTRDGPRIAEVSDVPNPWKPVYARGSLELASQGLRQPRRLGTPRALPSPSPLPPPPKSPMRRSPPSKGSGISDISDRSPSSDRTPSKGSGSASNAIAGASRWLLPSAGGTPPPPPPPAVSSPPEPGAAAAVGAADPAAAVAAKPASLFKRSGGGLWAKMKGALGTAAAAPPAAAGGSSAATDGGSPAPPAAAAPAFPAKVDFAAVVKAAVKDMAVPGSSLTIKSSALAIGKAADDILAALDAAASGAAGHASGAGKSAKKGKEGKEGK